MTTNALGPNELYLAISLVICFALCWAIMFLALRKTEDLLRLLYSEGSLLRG